MPERQVLITAGATRNPIDSMRFLSANSSGATGAWLARALCASRRVHLLGHPEAILRAGDGPTTEVFGSTRDLLARMKCWVEAHPTGTVIHAAAVGDYETDPAAGKVESGREEWCVRLRPTPKIADQLRGWAPSLTLVTFKAAPPDTPTTELITIARRQLQRTGSNLVFANVLGRLTQEVAIVEAAGETLFNHRSDALQALVDRVVCLNP